MSAHGMGRGRRFVVAVLIVVGFMVVLTARSLVTGAIVFGLAGIAVLWRLSGGLSRFGIDPLGRISSVWKRRVRRHLREDWVDAVHSFGLVRQRTPVPAMSDVEVVDGRVAGTWALPMGTTVADVRQREDAVAAFLGASWLQVETLSPGVVRLTWWAEPRPDPLAMVEPIDDALPWGGDWTAVPLGWAQDGAVAFLRMAETSGLVVGGLPGGGKTAGLSSLLASMVHRDNVQFLVWDGKGGSDWSWLADRAALHNSDDENRDSVAEQIEAVVALMRQRLDAIRAVRGGSSIWTTGGPTTDWPLLVLVVDECQSFLDGGAIPRSDKELHALRQRTEAALATLVRKGRSVGVLVILATQKPTSDSLPSTIGANASAAIAFRVKTPEAERAVLGSGPGPDDPSATDLPARPGYAVLASEDGNRQVVRFAYLPEERAAALAAAYTHLRVDLDGLRDLVAASSRRRTTTNGNREGEES